MPLMSSREFLDSPHQANSNCLFLNITIQFDTRKILVLTIESMVGMLISVYEMMNGHVITDRKVRDFGNILQITSRSGRLLYF